MLTHVVPVFPWGHPSQLRAIWDSFSFLIPQVPRLIPDNPSTLPGDGVEDRTKDLQHRDEDWGLTGNPVLRSSASTSASESSEVS